MEERTRSRTAAKFAESGRPPWWLRLLAVGLACGAVAIDGHSEEKGPVRVVVRTARRDELVAVLREGVAA